MKTHAHRTMLIRSHIAIYKILYCFLPIVCFPFTNKAVILLGIAATFLFTCEIRWLVEKVAQNKVVNGVFLCTLVHGKC